MRLRTANVIATWFGCGLSPVAPGTVGSLGAVAIAIVLHHYIGFRGPHFAILAVILFPAAVWSADVAAKAAKRKDPGFVVVDEVVGQWLALAGASVLSWRSFVGAFLLFRVFDIWKPPPVRQLEALPGGLGINAEDAMAGAYGALVLWLAGWFNLY